MTFLDKLQSRHRSALALALCLIAPGTIGFVAFGYYAIVDWTALQSAYAHYAQAIGSGTDSRTLQIADSAQNIHRINLFADGVWALLSAILAAIGLHGICLMPRSEHRNQVPPIADK